MGRLLPWGCHRPLGLGVMVQSWGAPHLSMAPWGCLDTLLQDNVGMGADARLIPGFGAGIYGGDVLQSSAGQPDVLGPRENI